MPDAVFKLIEGQRAVIHRRGQAEAKLHEVALAGHVTLEHPANLRHGDVGLVDDGEEVFGEVIQQRCWCRAGWAAIDVAGVVLDSGAEADLLDHFQIVLSAHA